MQICVERTHCERVSGRGEHVIIALKLAVKRQKEIMRVSIFRNQIQSALGFAHGSR